MAINYAPKYKNQRKVLYSEPTFPSPQLYLLRHTLTIWLTRVDIYLSLIWWVPNMILPNDDSPFCLLGFLT